MPKKGYAVVTISEAVLKQAQDFIDQTNKKAGYKKIRNVSHFVEEAMTGFAIDDIKKRSESPEEILQKVVEIVLVRDDLTKLICRHFLELPSEEASMKLHRLLSKTDIQRFRKLLEGGT